MDANEYMKHWIKNRVWTHLEWPRHQRRLRTCAAACTGSRHVDIGCAFGHSTHWLRKFHGELFPELGPGQWTGVDFAPIAIEKARAIFKDMEFLYVPDLADLIGTWDSVICSEVLEHVKDDKRFFAGLLRLARQRVFITTPCHRVSDPGHIRVYDRNGLLSLALGLEAEVTQDVDFFYLKVSLYD